MEKYVEKAPDYECEEPTFGYDAADDHATTAWTEEPIVPPVGYTNYDVYELGNRRPYRQGFYIPSASGKMYGNGWNSGAWSPSVPSVASWNRGTRSSVAPLAPSTTKMTPIYAPSSNLLAAQKYKRNAAYGSKNIYSQRPASLEMDDNGDLFLPFQDQFNGGGNGEGEYGPLYNMQPLSQYLNDISKGAGDLNGDCVSKGGEYSNNAHQIRPFSGFGENRGSYYSGYEEHPQSTVLDHSNSHLLDPQLFFTPYPLGISSSHLFLEKEEKYSRKVFVGGLPPDIDEEEISNSFRRFGQLAVDWPHKAESKSLFPPKGYAFLLFQEESSVQMLIDACIQEDEKLYLVVSSPTVKDKAVQIRPWRLNDADYVLNAALPLDPRKTVFVGGVPRPLKAAELATIMDRLYGCVCYAGIDTDPELKYPKGAGRVAFSNQQSYISAINSRFVQLQHGDIDKRVEVKPYVLDDQMCDECSGHKCGGKFAPFFCANVTCLQYYCDHCWGVIHSRAGRDHHKPLVKEGAERPRPLPFRWGG